MGVVLRDPDILILLSSILSEKTLQLLHFTWHRGTNYWGSSLPRLSRLGSLILEDTGERLCAGDAEHIVWSLLMKTL